jgi:uncharacterized protein (DUF433 family)
MRTARETARQLPDVLHEHDGEIRVKGHRITLYHVLSAYNAGISAHAMVFYYPTLSFDEIQRVLAFYEANREEVEDYLTKYQAELDRQRSTGKTVEIEALRRGFEAMRQAGQLPGQRPAGTNGQAAPGETRTPAT